MGEYKKQGNVRMCWHAIYHVWLLHDSTFNIYPHLHLPPPLYTRCHYFLFLLNIMRWRGIEASSNQTDKNRKIASKIMNDKEKQDNK